MSGNRESVLEVGGMSCGSCVRHVDHALRALDGVEMVEVQLQHGIVRVLHDAASVTAAALIEAVEGAGYTARARA